MTEVEKMKSAPFDDPVYTDTKQMVEDTLKEN